MVFFRASDIVQEFEEYRNNTVLFRINSNQICTLRSIHANVLYMYTRTKKTSHNVKIFAV